LVIRQVVLNLDNWILILTYLVGSVIGSIGMHYIAMKYLEKQILKMLGLVILQDASFTLVSRARNSDSITYHTLASILSNGI